MRLSTHAFIVCTAICMVCLHAQHSNAQTPLLPASLTSFAPEPADTSPAEPSNLQNIDRYLSQQPIYACACGCGIFDVGTSSMLPTGEGGMVWVQYDYQDQNINWNGHGRAPAAFNPDKKIETNFYTPGIQYMFNRSWGIQAELPIADRFFETTGGATGHDIIHSTWTAMGDLRVEGIYTGFFEDQSAGVTFGLKLPTGNYTHNNPYGDVDRDSEIGTGSTDLLLGGFYRHTLSRKFNLDWFGQVLLDLPFICSSDSSGTYRPGAELDSALGVYYTGLRLGHVRISPLAQVLASVRRQDSGSAAAMPVASGYQRILLSPGVEFDFHPFMVYTDVELPVYQNTNGDQLTGSFLVKASISYRF